MQHDKEGKSIEDIIKQIPYETAYSVINADNATFEKNAGYQSMPEAVVLKYCMLHPEKTFLLLTETRICRLLTAW